LAQKTPSNKAYLQGGYMALLRLIYRPILILIDVNASILGDPKISARKEKLCLE
jgi:hypothetical protein